MTIKKQGRRDAKDVFLRDAGSALIAAPAV
jgi:hypothetical protein